MLICVEVRCGYPFRGRELLWSMSGFKSGGKYKLHVFAKFYIIKFGFYMKEKETHGVV